MKYFISSLLLIACFLFSQKAEAQKTLEFNQVLMVSSLDTVPSGKVWKVVSALGPMIKSACSTSPAHEILVNGSAVGVGNSGQIVFDSYCYGWEGIAIVTDFPFWLPEGNTLAPSYNVTSVSVIEFNVVP